MQVRRRRDASAANESDDVASLPLLSRWTRTRDLPELPKDTFRDIWKKELSKDKEGH